MIFPVKLSQLSKINFQGGKSVVTMPVVLAMVKRGWESSVINPDVNNKLMK